MVKTYLENRDEKDEKFAEKTTKGEAFRNKQNKFPYFALVFFSSNPIAMGSVLFLLAVRWDKPKLDLTQKNKARFIYIQMLRKSNYIWLLKKEK